MSKALFFEDVRILSGGFRNFSRRKDRFGNDKMNFNFEVDSDTAKKLRKDGFNVREISGREDGDDSTQFIKVNVNFDSQYGGPEVEMITKNSAGRNVGKVKLDKDTIAALDDAIIISADIWVNPYKSEPAKYSSLYLERMEVFVEESVMDAKYSIDSEEDDSFPF